MNTEAGLICLYDIPHRQVHNCIRESDSRSCQRTSWTSVHRGKVSSHRGGCYSRRVCRQCSNEWLTTNRRLWGRLGSNGREPENRNPTAGPFRLGLYLTTYGVLLHARACILSVQRFRSTAVRMQDDTPSTPSTPSCDDASIMLCVPRCTIIDCVPSGTAICAVCVH